MKKLFKNIIALGFGIGIALLILELYLRIFNPFGFRVKGNNIILPANQKYTFNNTSIPGLDNKIEHTKNSLGFRGPEKSANFDSLLSIITIGGSTTECFYISDGRTWPELLATKLSGKLKNVWLDNAGLDGHSTFGHQYLLSDHIIKLKPKVLLFLVGCNDVAIDNLTRDDKWSLGKNQGFLTNFEIYNNWMGFKRASIASRKGIGHQALKAVSLTKLSVDSIAERILFDSIMKNFIPKYKIRISKLIKLSMDNGIYPVFISQPTLAGADQIQGIDAHDLDCGGWRAQFYAKVLNTYNESLEVVCKEHGAGYINTSQLNRNEENFYDFFHFNNIGCQNISNIIFPNLLQILKSKFPNFEKS